MDSLSLRPNPDDELAPELRPRPCGMRGPDLYERRLRQDVARLVPTLEAVLRAAGLTRGLQAWRVALFEALSVERPSRLVRTTRETSAGRAEVVLRELMIRDGLSLELACARGGYNIDRVRVWLRENPAMGRRFAAYRREAAAKIHGVLWAKASAAKDENVSLRAATFLAEHCHQDDFPTQVQRVQVSEADVERSAAFVRFKALVLGAVCDDCKAALLEQGEGQ